MATKLRLQRHGRKRHAYYQIVVADSRAPRDGKFIERVGSYNPNTNPATIELNLDKTVTWLENGAQPTDTVRAILSYKGVLYKHHLNKGVKKGALTQEQADAKFAQWLEQKTSKVDSKKDKISKEKTAALAVRLKQEEAKKLEIANRIIAKNTPPTEESPAVEEVVTDSADTVTQEEQPTEQSEVSNSEEQSPE